MPTVSQIVKIRNQRRNEVKHHPLMKIGLAISILLCLAGVVVCIEGLWLYTNITRDLPSIEVLPSLLEPPDGVYLQPTRLYDRTNLHLILTLENPSAAGKRYLKVGKEGGPGISQFSQFLIDATIAESDPSYWKHPGYSLAGWFEGTHPTLAQRLISDLVLIDEPPSIQRNIRERLLAAQVTDRYGREKILEWYLNSAEYGDLIYGADAAARVFFGKTASELDLAEAAMLTTISKSPEMNPYTGTQLLKQKQEQIIQTMLYYGLVSVDKAQNAIDEDINFQAPQEKMSIASAFASLVLEQLGSKINLQQVRRGGFDIITTLDYDLQIQVYCATKTQIARMQESQQPVVTLGDDDCKAAQLLPNLQMSSENPLQDLHAEVVVLDPQSGQILSLVGDDISENDPSIQQGHTAGTILSPFVYLTAFSRGISPGTLLWDIPRNNEISIMEIDGDNLPQSSSETFHGPVRARTAMVNDYLEATAQVLQQVRLDNALVTAKRFGLSISSWLLASETTLSEFYSNDASLMEIITAYAVMANQGVMTGQPELDGVNDNDPDGLKPTTILRVVDTDGVEWVDWIQAQSRPIISPQLAYLATHVLSDENARWPSLGHPNSLEIGRPVAAKVGITEASNDAWTVGYIPQLAVGVWIGHRQQVAGDISPEIPAGLWHAIIKYASMQLSVQEFTVPTGIIQIQVCDPSGLLVSKLCPRIVQEAFLEGNEPTQVDNLYQKFYVNRDSGQLATIFTPAEMVEEKVFLVVPPDAKEWAMKAGLPIPPDTYDVIYAKQERSSNVHIISPETFDHVKGQVRFIGTAAGADFLYYRLQVGQGLYPQQWIQIGEDSNQPVKNGLLGIWNTDGMQGLFVVQLQVIRMDQRVEYDIIQLTVDNIGPQVQILAPTPDEEFTFQQGESIMIQLEVNDNLMLEKVEFLVNNELLTTLFQPPYVIVWPERLGAHILLVRAYDLAGNLTESTVSFSVTK
jgi:membrane carboxypeptidase/penicillin-binding protein